MTPSSRQVLVFVASGRMPSPNCWGMWWRCTYGR